MKKIKITTDEELIYVMRFYGIPLVPTYSCDGNHCGYVRLVDGKLTYDPKRCFYRWRDPKDAFRSAYTDINMVIELKERVDKPLKAVAVYHNQTYEGVKISEETWSGTMDEVFVRLEEANRHLRYCNGCYWYFKDERIKRLHQVWDYTMPESRSFDLYYGGGVVD